MWVLFALKEKYRLAETDHWHWFPAQGTRCDHHSVMSVLLGQPHYYYYHLIFLHGQLFKSNFCYYYFYCYFDWLVEAIHLVSKSTLSSFFSELFFLHNFSKSTLWWKRQKVKDNLWKVSPSLKQWNVIKRQHLAIILVLVFVFFTFSKIVFFNLFKLFCISNLLKLFCVFLFHQFGTFLVCLNFVNFESLEWGQPATIYQYTGFGPLPDLWTKPDSELKSNTK